MRVVEDATEVARAGSWVMAATHGWSQVRSLVPDVFESYARIFHPAMREADERDLPLRAPDESQTGVPAYARDAGVVWREVSWREVAEANGRVAHPAMQWASITGSCEFEWGGMQPGVWERVPQHDSLPLRLTRVLCEILAGFTNTPDRCMCAVWEGYADVVGVESDLTLPRLAILSRPMIVACGPLRAVPEKSFSDPYTDRDGEDDRQCVESYRSPSLWWPDDRAWCVATDVDMQETYVGASADCVGCLIDDGRLEAMRVTAEQSVAFDADTINPTPTDDRSKR